MERFNPQTKEIASKTGAATFASVLRPSPKHICSSEIPHALLVDKELTFVSWEQIHKSLLSLLKSERFHHSEAGFYCSTEVKFPTGHRT